MTQTLNVTKPLTDEEQRKVQAFAEQLIAHRSVENTPQGQQHVNVDALHGMFAGLGGDKTTKELIREAWDEIAAKYD
jgi:hypothetical protein